jgi:Xaa-Pro aminopeptidase
MSAPGLGAPTAADRAAKRERVLGVLDDANADELVLTSHGAVSWYLGGTRTHTSLAGDPLLAVVVDRDRDRVVLFSNERDRLEAEELPVGVTVATVPWHEPLSSALPAGPRVIHEADVAHQLRAVRAALLPAELEAFRALGRDCAEVATAVLREARSDESERDIAAGLGAGLIARGIDPLVLLVAGRDRLGHRHPLPTDGALGDRAMVVLCGRRAGLVANLTRWVRFGPARPHEADAERRIREVEAAFFAGTVAGSTLGQAFDAGIAGYAAHGFDPLEWQRHHQGGAAGYNGRDPRATPGAGDVIQLGQAFAWNPTAPAAKIEDTVLLTADGIEVLTADDAWPTVTVGGIRRPIELEKRASL